MKILKLYFLLLLMPSITLPTWKNKELFRPEKLTNFKPTKKQDDTLEQRVRKILDEEKEQLEHKKQLEDDNRAIHLFYQLIFFMNERTARDKIRNEYLIALQKQHNDFHRPQLPQPALQENKSHLQYFRFYSITNIKQKLLSLPSDIMLGVKAFIQKKTQ